MLVGRSGLSSEAIRGAVLGHVIGDALGVPVEFFPREKLDDSPVSQMQSNGTHHMPKGTWSDDSSMMLCTLMSIVEKETLDFDDMMSRFSRWVKEGYMTPHGKPFGIGRSTLSSLGRYWRGEIATKCGGTTEKDNGNGSLMRILPVVLYNAFASDVLTDQEKIRNVCMVSSLTHAHPRAYMACGIYSFILEEVLEKPNKSSVHAGLDNARNFFECNSESRYYERLFSIDFGSLPKTAIKSSGYVVDTLEAAVWCILNSDSYKEAVLQAVNLGGDTDTIAAVAGGLAGALYTYSALEQEWLDAIVKRDGIMQICDRFEKKLDML